MVKYMVMACIIFEDNVTRDNVKTYIRNQISEKSTWKETILESMQDMQWVDPRLILSIRFENKDDMTNLFQKIKERLPTIKSKIKSARVTYHNCSHDTVPFKPCKIDKEYVI